MSTTGFRQFPGGLACRTVSGVLPATAAALSLSSAIAHFGVVTSHRRERWAQNDLITTAGELAPVVLILMLGERPRRWGMNMALLTAVGLWAGKATGFLV